MFSAFPCQEFFYLHLNSLDMHLFQRKIQKFLSPQKFLVLVLLNP